MGICHSSEVGLQAAATRISQVLLQKTVCAADVEANLGSFSQMVDVLGRLNREIAILQKQRDESRRSLSRAHDPARIKDEEQMSALESERLFSDRLPVTTSPSRLSRRPCRLSPPPPSLPMPIAKPQKPRDSNIARNRVLETVKLFSGKNSPAATVPQSAPAKGR